MTQLWKFSFAFSIKMAMSCAQRLFGGFYFKRNKECQEVTGEILLFDAMSFELVKCLNLNKSPGLKNLKLLG